MVRKLSSLLSQYRIDRGGEGLSSKRYFFLLFIPSYSSSCTAWGTEAQGFLLRRSRWSSRWQLLEPGLLELSACPADLWPPPSHNTRRTCLGCRLVGSCRFSLRSYQPICLSQLCWTQSKLVRRLGCYGHCRGMNPRRRLRTLEQ